MLDQLLKLAEENLGGLSHNIPNLQNVESVKLNNITSQTIINTVMQQLKGGNLNAIKELFSGEHTVDDGDVVSELKTPVANNLMNKLGIDKGNAMQIAMMAIPIVLNMLNGRVKTAQNNGLDIGGLLNQLNNKGGGGFLNSIMNMFGGGNNNNKVINQLIQGLLK